MTLTLVSQPEYTIDTPGFEHYLFAESSTTYLTLPDAVTFAAHRNCILQSAREAIAFRIAANGKNDANLYQMTRTSALYFHDGNQYYVAFDDDPAENISLARAQEGFDAHDATGTWLVKYALKRAARTNRIVPAPLENEVRLSTAPRNGTSDYGSNNIVRATIGDMAVAYAAFLNQRRYSSGTLWLLTPDNLEQLGIANNQVEVRRVVVGGIGNNDNMNNLDAIDQFYIGRARGVRNISTGNNGGR